MYQTKAATRRPINQRITIDATRALPNPKMLAEEYLAAKAHGASLLVQQRDGIRFKFDAFDWLLELDAAMHAHGARDWADAVTFPFKTLCDDLGAEADRALLAEEDGEDHKAYSDHLWLMSD